MKIFIIIILVIFSISCRVGVELPFNVTYTLNNPEEISIETLANQKYLNYYNKFEYKNKFENYLKESLTKYNLSETSQLNFNYKINISNFRVYELFNHETVSDESSPDFGKEFNINSCYVSYTFSLENNGVKFYERDIYESKSEEITNRRSFFDYLFGTNKDNSSYRQKDLPQDVFDKIVENAAKAGAAKISRKIKKQLKSN